MNHVSYKSYTNMNEVSSTKMINAQKKIELKDMLTKSQCMIL